MFACIYILCVIVAVTCIQMTGPIPVGFPDSVQKELWVGASIYLKKVKPNPASSFVWVKQVLNEKT